MNLSTAVHVGLEFAIIGPKPNFVISALRNIERIKSRTNISKRSLNIMAMIDPRDDDFGAICNCAVRYAVGRRTYMPSLVIDFITPHLGELSDKTLWCFQSDLEERKNGFFDFGDEFDKTNWMSFLDAVNKEIKRREKHE
nr:MAG TPA: hypothetical protein [Caudoviricetes sp.]